MPPTTQQKALQITSTDSFAIAHPDEVKSEAYSERIEKNRALLEKTMPEMRERSLGYSLYP
jgi:hypothetical protein